MLRYELNTNAKEMIDELCEKQQTSPEDILVKSIVLLKLKQEMKEEGWSLQLVKTGSPSREII